MQLSNDPVTQAGLKTRRAVLGDEYVDKSLANATPFTAPFQELVTHHAWGNTWQRTGIDLKTRSMVTVAMLVALGRMHELKVHVRGALNNGVTPAELIRTRRVENIHQELQGQAGDAGVLEVASRWGVRNRSTLVHNYRSRFDETPTQTLRGAGDGVEMPGA